MTDRDKRPHNDLNPDSRPHGRGPRRNGFAWLMGLAAILVIAGLVITTMGRNDRTTAGTDRPAATTGAATSDPTGANAPRQSPATDPSGANRASGAIPRQ